VLCATFRCKIACFCKIVNVLISFGYYSMGDENPSSERFYPDFCFKVACVSFFHPSLNLAAYSLILRRCISCRGQVVLKKMLWLWLMWRKWLWPVISLCFVWCGKPRARQPVPHLPIRLGSRHHPSALPRL